MLSPITKIPHVSAPKSAAVQQPQEAAAAAPAAGAAQPARSFWRDLFGPSTPASYKDEKAARQSIFG